MSIIVYGHIGIEVCWRGDEYWGDLVGVGNEIFKNLVAVGSGISDLMWAAFGYIIIIVCGLDIASSSNGSTV